MKRKLTVIVGLAFFGCLAACSKPSTGIPSVEKTSFDAVTSQLDKGGTLYLYLSTEKTAKAAEDLAGRVRTVIASQAFSSEAQKDEALRGYDFVVDLVKKSGLMEISGFGASSVAMTEEINHSKFIAHHYRGQGSGLLWQMWGERPHPLNDLKLLPADTVLAQFSDRRLDKLWQFAQAEAEGSEFPKLKQGLESFRQMMDRQGIPMDKLLESLDQSSGFLLTLDIEKKSVIQAGPMKLEIPEPGLAIVLGVKDDTLFDFLASKMTFAEKSEEQGTKRLRVPALPLPIPLQPEVVQSGRLLILASHASVTDAILSARDKGDGLIATEEFKSLSKSMPEQGNGFGFMARRFSQEIMAVQKQALQASGKSAEEAGAAKILDMFSKGNTWYGVLQNTEEGLVYTVNHSTDLEEVALLTAVGAVGMATAAIIPNLTRAKAGKK